jgi:hypothetical protein
MSHSPSFTTIDPAMSNITHTEIRMYRMGTGDCFVLKFFAGAALKYKMLIDCGTWSGSAAHLAPYIHHLKAYVENHVDLLVVTHEHKDHVHVFDACENLFTQGFAIDRVWMGWTEKDSAAKVKRWQKDYGQQKMALFHAARELKAAVHDPAYAAQLQHEFNGLGILNSRRSFAATLEGLTDLHVDTGGGTFAAYVGLLAGMRVVKKNLGPGKIAYYKPGDIIANLQQLPGIKFFVLGPPLSWEDVKKESGAEGESYDHNKDLALSAAFAAAVLDQAVGGNLGAAPFDASYNLAPGESICQAQQAYTCPGNEWRKIEHEWLLGAGSLALRINSLTNNLSLALAIEFEDSGRVMLFPGDAEYGSWASWHRINWTEPSRTPGKHLTEDLLNRTVFYKVAHHLSHNGTAQRLGLEMMKDPDLAAMATLDYSVIGNGWTTTMPNRAILAELLARTKGRLMVMNEKGLFLDREQQIPLADRIQSARSQMSTKMKTDFARDHVEDPLYLQYTVRG